MQTRDKPVENTTPSEPIKVIKSDAMKNMVEAMNRRHEESRANQIEDEPVKIVVGEGGPGVPPPPPPPPPPSGGGAAISSSPVPPPPSGGIPPPPPPPPPPVFDPSKVKKRPKKPVKKKEPPKPSPPASSGPSLKDQLMKVALKKVGK